MNTILLQKILDILREGLAHVGNFFKDLFVSDPQNGQVIAYDAESGHWVNKDATEVELDLTNTFEAQAVATITDGAENVPMQSLVVDIVPKQASGTPTPSSPLPISGTDEFVITHTGKNLVFSKIDATVDASGTIISSTNYYKFCIAKVAQGQTYTVTTSDTSLVCGFFYDVPEVGDTTYNGSRIVDTQSKTFVAPITGYVGFRAIYDGNYQCEAGSTATTYEPYTATTHTVTLSASIENGYIDVISGQGKDTDNDTDITCTPTQIKTQGGTESIFADCGDVSGEYYTKTAGDVKSLVCITEDITSQITKNTTDFSDILLKVSQNNKVVSIEIYNATTAKAVNDTFLSNLPKPAMNCPVMVLNKTVGEEGIFYGSLSTSGALNITVPGAKSFGGLITYVAK